MKYSISFCHPSTHPERNQNIRELMLTLKSVTDFILEAWSSGASFIVNLLTIVGTSLSHFQIALAHVGECLATATSIDNMHSSRATAGSVCKHNRNSYIHSRKNLITQGA